MYTEIWMQEKKQKILLHLIILTAIAMSIASSFTPIIKFDYSDVLEEYGYETSDQFWVLERFLFFSKISVYDLRDTIDEKGREYYKYSFAGITIFTSGQKGDWIVLTDYNVDHEILISRSLGSMIELVLTPTFLILFIYFLYKIVNNNCSSIYRKNIFLLYLCLFLLLILIATIFGFYSSVVYSDSQNLGFTSFIHFGYGFYLICASIILFFIAYIIQFYFFKISKETVYIKDKK